MRTHVQEWGGSLAVRIPKSIAAQAGIHANSQVELSVVQGKIVVHVVSTELDELLKGVTDENLHGEWNTGPAVGREIWA